MSNRTPSETNDATASAPKARRRSPLLGVVLVLFGLFVLFTGIQGLFDDKIRLATPRGLITVQVADEDAERIKGLSGRAALGKNEGLLFIFENSGDHCIWMKDMNFAIDIVWMNSDKKVIDIESQVSPDTYPESFCPSEEAVYVLELPSNRAQELDIVLGSTLRW